MHEFARGDNVRARAPSHPLVTFAGNKGVKKKAEITFSAVYQCVGRRWLGGGVRGGY